MVSCKFHDMDWNLYGKMSVNAEPEITVGHQTFSNRIYGMTRHFRFWSDIMSGQFFWFFIDLKYFLLIKNKNQLCSDIMSWHFSHLISCSVNMDACGAKLLLTTVLAYPVDCACFCHLLKTQHHCLCPTLPHHPPHPPPTHPPSYRCHLWYYSSCEKNCSKSSGIS